MILLWVAVPLAVTAIIAIVLSSKDSEFDQVKRRERALAALAKMKGIE